MTDARTARRLARLEAQVDALTRGLQLTLVAAQPASKWLDAKMAAIDRAYAIPPASPDEDQR